jgi:hypothetical protein
MTMVGASVGAAGGGSTAEWLRQSRPRYGKRTAVRRDAAPERTRVRDSSIRAEEGCLLSLSSLNLSGAKIANRSSNNAFQEPRK